MKTFQIHFVVLHRLCSESTGLCFFAFGKSLVFFTSDVVFFIFCLSGLSFLCGASSVDGGTCTGARSRDLGGGGGGGGPSLSSRAIKILDNQWLKW